jgi:hypothetical protein
MVTQKIIAPNKTKIAKSVLKSAIQIDVKQCRNCSKPQPPIHHTLLDPDCPVRIREKAIIEIKINNRMSHWQAKQEFQRINGLASSNGPTYDKTAATTNKETPEKTNLMERLI